MRAHFTGADGSVFLPNYLIYGCEVGDSGTPHLQGYLELPKPMSIVGLKQALPYLHSAHLEPRFGTQEQAINYCKKDGKYHDYGHPKAQGKRSDLDAIRLEIISGELSVREIADTHFGLWCVYRRAFEEFAELRRGEVRTAPYESIVVDCYWGSTGTGKTRKAYDENPGLYSWPGGLWFDGYSGESVLLLDEFDGSQIPFRDLLRILDRYPLRVAVKGGFKHAAWKKVVITSNKVPSSWYPFEDFAPLERRITNSVEFK